MFSPECAQLLPEGKDLQAEAVAGTEESAEANEEADKKWNHELGCIEVHPGARVNCLNFLPHGVNGDTHWSQSADGTELP
jgi:hypothetical protein